MSSFPGVVMQFSFPHLLALAVVPREAALSALIFAAALALLISRRRRNTANAPPGSLGLPFLGEYIHFLLAVDRTKGIYGFIDPRRSRFGAIFKTSMFGKVNVFISSSKEAKLVLTREFDVFTKKLARSYTMILGNQCFDSLSPSEHRKVRCLIAEPFSFESVKKHIGNIEISVTDALSSWEGRTVIVVEEAQKFEFQRIANMFLGLRKGDPLVDKLLAECHHISRGAYAIPINIPGLRFHRGMKARKFILSVLDELISQRRNGSVKNDDLLQAMINRDKLGHDERMTDAQLKDVLLSLLVGGFTTTATTLAWCLKYLGDNPGTLETLKGEHFRLRKEKKDPSGPLTWEDLSRMAYTKQVIQETLRLANVVHHVPREVLHDVDIGGYILRKGWTANVDFKSMHMDPHVFQDPSKFDPSRFQGKKDLVGFLPFGLGPRFCVGSKLAVITITIFLHYFTTKYRWSPIGGDYTLDSWTFLTSSLKSGYPIIVEKID